MSFRPSQLIQDQIIVNGNLAACILFSGALSSVESFLPIYTLNVNASLKPIFAIFNRAFVLLQILDSSINRDQSSNEFRIIMTI